MGVCWANAEVDCDRCGCVEFVEPCETSDGGGPSCRVSVEECSELDGWTQVGTDYFYCPKCTAAIADEEK